MIEIIVELDSRSYPIAIGQGLLEQAGERIGRRSGSAGTVIVTDENVRPLYGDRVLESLRQAGGIAEILSIPAGESSKSLGTAGTLYDSLLEIGLERSSQLVALGGGVVGDLTGFVAATLYRGIPFVQMPTTLEADVDASVGGKTGVNHHRGKNLIGAFHQPSMVLIDTDTLGTLPARDFRAGLAESIKHALAFDGEFFEWHERHIDEVLTGDPKLTAELIAWNCRIKASIVAQDEREAGVRAMLNLGHTIGHAFEAEAEYNLRHGEAVGLGLIACLEIAVNRGLIEKGLIDRLQALIDRCKLPGSHTGFHRPRIVELMARDKKIVDGRLSFVLLTGLGQAEIFRDVTTEEINLALDRVAAEHDL
jgi:3-dehydroquinate synthase